MKDTSSPDEILSAAERFLAKDNFFLAKEWFEKIPAALRTREIRDKIDRCGAQLNAERAKVLAKRASKLKEKGKLGEALSSYREAFALSPLSWIQTQIDALAGNVREKNVAEEAKSAERRADFPRASELCGELFDRAKSAETLLRYAVSLARAGKAEEAGRMLREHAALTNEPSILTRKQRYDYGYVLARIGDYAGCMAAWNALQPASPALDSQKKSAVRMWESALHADFKAGAPIQQIRSGIDLFARYDRSDTIDALRYHCRFTTAEELCAQGRYKDAIDMLPAVPAGLSEAAIFIYAKLYYHAGKVRESVSAVRYSMFVLTALARIGFFDSRESDASSENRDHRRLTDQLDDIAKTMSGLDADGYQCNVTALRVLCEILPINVKESLLLPPFMAVAMRKSAAIFEHVEGARDRYPVGSPDHASFMTAYLFYGKHARLLYDLYDGAIDYAAVPPVEPRHDDHQDFTAGAFHAKLAFGCFEDSRCSEGREFLIKAGACLGENVTPLSQLTAQFLDAPKADIQVLTEIEKALTVVNKKRRDVHLDTMIARLVVKRATANYHGSGGSFAPVMDGLRKALRMLPGEFHTDDVDEMLLRGESERVAELLGKYKFNQAADLVAKSEFSMVHELFFDCIATMLTGARNDPDFDDPVLVRSALQPLLNACMKVNPLHTVTRELIHELSDS